MLNIIVRDWRGSDKDGGVGAMSAGLFIWII